MWKLLLNGFFILTFSITSAQEMCVHDDFEKFKNNIDANCRNLIISNIIFAHNGFRFQVIGETPELDSFADYIARNNALYEVNFETTEKDWTEEQTEQLEKNICDYIQNRDSLSVNKIFPEAFPKLDYRGLLPENVKSAFFMIHLGFKD